MIFWHGGILQTDNEAQQQLPPRIQTGPYVNIQAKFKDPKTKQ
jgi:hypothetical protein